ncbi:methylmalonyl-CoA mutase family protein [bacterium]|jgi:methylmalonyl-CoA mutase N-terminal domain/subunit|nr:methylmalonyl-CoA mutase family protein [bacterium]
MSKEIESKQKDWEERLKASEKKAPPRLPRFSTISDMEVPLLSTPIDFDREKFDYLRDLGFPGEFPFTRGVYPSMYRGKMWTMRQFAGFSTAADTNKRFKYLLANGQMGLSTAFDMPTLMGYDPDSPKGKGEVGKCGVSVASLEDMEELFSGIPLGDVTTSMTINGPAIVILAMYLAVAEKQGVPREKVRGTLQNDILKEYIAQKEWLFPVKSAVKLVTDTIEFGTKYYPGWNTVSISGYHIREAGATAVQELAFTLSDGLAYVDDCLKRGMNIDDFAPRLSFFFDVHNDFFEEIAKFRAARRIWANLMRDRYKAKDPKSWMLRTHAQTAGVSLTAQQPYNNIVRVAIQAVAGVLGGTNSLHTNSMDETLALPTDEAVMIALRTQQIIAEETGIANVADPLGGSYFVEVLTNRVEREALEYIRKIDEMGGMVAAVERGFPQAEIANSAYLFQRQMETGERVMVGVNKYQMTEEKRTLETLYIDRTVEKRQIQKLVELRKKRSKQACQDSLRVVREQAQAGANLCGPIIEAVKTYATLQEVCDTLRGVYGEYREAGSF